MATKGLYLYSPQASKTQFYLQGDRGAMPVGNTGQGYLGTKSRPQLYITPTGRGRAQLAQSWDDKTVAFRPDEDQLRKNQKAFLDILDKIREKKAFEAIEVPDAPDLNRENREGKEALSRNSQSLIARGILSPARAREMDKVAENPPPRNEKSVLNRIIDVLSRPVYTGASASLAAVNRGKEEDRIEHRLFLESLTPRERSVAIKYDQEFWDRAPQSDRKPQNMRVGGGPRRTTPMMDTLIKKFEEAERRAKRRTEDFGQDPGEAALEGLRGEQKNTWSDVIDAHSPRAPNWVKAVGGFTGDVLLDPTTYIPGVVFTKPVSAGRSAATNVARTVTGRSTVSQRAVQQLELGNRAEDLRKIFDAETRSGVVDPQLLDRVTSPVSQPGVRVTAARELSSGLSRQVGAAQFQRFFNANIEKAVTSGRLTPEVRDLFVADQAFNSVDDAVRATSQRLIIPPTPGPTSALPTAAPITGARQYVADIMRRGELSSRIAQGMKNSEDVSGLQSRIAKMDERLGSVGLSNEIRGFVNKSPKTRAMHAAHGDLVRWRNALTAAIEKGKAVSSPYVVRSLRSIMDASDKGLKYNLMRALGGKGDAATSDISRIINEYSSTVARPNPSEYKAALNTLKAGKNDVAQAVVNRHRAWHVGLLNALTDTLKGKVTDDIANRIVAEASSNPSLLDSLANFVPHTGVQVPKSLPKTDESFKSLGPALTDEVRAIIAESREQVAAVNRALEGTVLEMIARSDAHQLTKGELLDPVKFDAALEKKTLWDVPLRAKNTFDDLFRPSSGLSKDINEQRLRYMGSANENVQHRASQLVQAYKGTSPRARKADLRAFLQHGVMSPTTDAFVHQMNDVLRTYASQYVVHPYGPNGIKVLGDLSRWLPDKYKIPKEVLKDESGIRNVQQLFEALNLSKKKMDKLDPMDMAWHFMVAHEKVLAEKQIMHTLVDEFGIRKTGLAATALRGPNLGYVTNRRFGDEVFFHPEISQQIDKLFDLVHSPQATNAFTGYIDTVNSIYKSVLSVYNPVWHFQNVIGDTFTGWLDGVTGPRGIASYTQAAKAMALKRKMAEGIREAIHTPGASVPATAGPRHTLFRMRNGISVNMEDTWGYYNKHGLQSGFVSTEFTHSIRHQGPLGPLARANRPLQVAAQAQADFFRLAHFIDRMKRSKAKTPELAAQEAAEAVRKYKFDYNDYTQFEKQVMSRVIPFYKFSRKNIPLMLGTLFTRPEKLLRVPKAMTAFAVNAGFDPEGFMPTTDLSSLMPDWYQQAGEWPIAEYNGNIISSNPQVPFIQPFKQYHPGDEEAGGRGLLKPFTPALTYPLNVAQKSSVFKEGAYETYGQAAREEAKSLVPQIRLKDDIEGGDRFRVLEDLTGSGRRLTDKDEANELKYRWKQFYEILEKEGVDFDEVRPTTRISDRQYQYLMDLMIQRSAPPKPE